MAIIPTTGITPGDFATEDEMLDFYAAEDGVYVEQAGVYVEQAGVYVIGETRVDPACTCAPFQPAPGAHYPDCEVTCG